MRIRHRGRSFLVLIPGTNLTISILDGEQDVPDHIGEQLVRQGRVDPVYFGEGIHRGDAEDAEKLVGAPPAAPDLMVGAGLALPDIQPGATLAEPPTQPAEVPTSPSARSRRKT